MFFYKTIIIYRLKPREFEKPILYIWNSFPSKLSAALLNLHRVFSSSRHFSMSNIWTYFSLKNILLRSPKDISCSFQFSPLFQVVFPFKFLVYSCHRKESWVSLTSCHLSDTKFRVIFTQSIHTASDKSTRLKCMGQTPFPETHLTVSFHYNIGTTPF